MAKKPRDKTIFWRIKRALDGALGSSKDVALQQALATLMDWNERIKVLEGRIEQLKLVQPDPRLIIPYIEEALANDRRDKKNLALRRAKADLVEAARVVQPFAHYARMRAAQPLRGLDDVIHGIHIGTEWEAELRLSDCKAAAKLQNRLFAKEGHDEQQTTVPQQARS